MLDNAVLKDKNSSIDGYTNQLVPYEVVCRTIELLNYTLGRLERRIKRLNLIYIDDLQMTQMHTQYLDNDSTTDVLTFDLSDSESCDAIEGDIYICVDQAKREATRRGISLERELMLYALHGCLHLCGFDDGTESDFRQIHRLEDQILIDFGIGETFYITTN